jgi:hypothetical protein
MPENAVQNAATKFTESLNDRKVDDVNMNSDVAMLAVV